MEAFNKLHAVARSLESDCDTLLAEFADIAENPPLDTSTSDAIVASVEKNITERTKLSDQLFSMARQSPEFRALGQAQRHAELLEDQKASFRRLGIALSQERSRRTLLTSVRSDISAHRNPTAHTSFGDGDVDADAYYATEARRVEGANSVADSLLARAYEARAELVRQQATIAEVQRRIFRALSHVPGLNTLISKINTRQKRNSLILATVITVGVLFLLFVH